MEIALLPKSVVKIKGKTASFVVNPQVSVPANAILLLDPKTELISDEAVVFNGAGEYEVGGVKITGLQNDKGVLYSLHIDSMDILVGSISLLSVMQNKLKEYNMVLVNGDAAVDASFLTSLAVNGVLFYGEKAEEIATGFEKEKLKRMNKYAASLGKLPAEMETILLN